MDSDWDYCKTSLGKDILGGFVAILHMLIMSRDLEASLSVIAFSKFRQVKSPENHKGKYIWEQPKS